uniref:Hypothetical secreted peptide n=1 Tax=Glossina morsitans morsitans TaxID=37546 RepID=D3TSQ0_GLOMM
MIAVTFLLILNNLGLTFSKYINLNFNLKIVNVEIIKNLRNSVFFLILNCIPTSIRWTIIVLLVNGPL